MPDFTEKRKYEPEHCPICGASFTCKVANITQCHCSKIKLENRMLYLLRDHFNSCLCPNCLKAAAKINAQEFENGTQEELLQAIVLKRLGPF